MREQATATTDNRPPKFQDVFGHTLLELARADERIVGITAAMPGGTGIDILQAQLPERTFDVGISEGHAVTFAGGLAREGKHPFVAIYSSFLQRAYDEIIHDVAIAGLPVTFCLDRGGLVGEDGVTHHGLFDLAYLRCIPGMTVAAPADEHDLRRLMYTSVQDGMGPFAIRYPRGHGHLTDWRCPLDTLPVGHGRCVARGNGHLAVLTLGPVRYAAQAAIERLAQDNTPTDAVALYDMIYLKPLDTDIMAEAERCAHIVTVEDGTTAGGLGSAVAQWLAQNGSHARLTTLGVDDRFIDQGTVAQQHALCGIDTESIYRTLKQLLTEL